VRDACWSVVAGGVDLGETFADAATRELLEEAGLARVAVMDLDLRQHHPIGDDRRPYLAGVRILELRNYAVEAPPNWEPTLNDEHDEYQWCTYPVAFSMLSFLETRQALAALHQRLTSSKAANSSKER
jgi:8-oxo-dGTP pyrophosphatase MutT (NUDIX family)